MNTLLSIISPNFILREALLETIFLGLICPYVGVFFVLRRMIFLAVTLPQVSSAGIAFAFLMGGVLYNEAHGTVGERALATLGSFVFVMFAIISLSLFERQKLFPRDAQTSIAYGLCSALTVFFLALDPHGEALMVSLLRGDLLSATEQSLLFCLVSFLAIGLLLFLFRREFLLISFDRDQAFLLNLPVKRLEILLYSICGATVCYGVMVAGTLVTFGLLVFPPLAARCLSNQMRGFGLIASVIGGFSSFLGFYLSYTYDFPLGPTVVLVTVAALVLSWTARLIRYSSC